MNLTRYEIKIDGILNDFQNGDSDKRQTARSIKHLLTEFSSDLLSDVNYLDAQGNPNCEQIKDFVDHNQASAIGAEFVGKIG